MEQDDRSRSLLLAVFDGHGEAGDLVAGYFKRELPSRLFAHPEFVTDLHKSLTETLDIIEREIIADTSVDTDFSGSTAVVSVVRGNVVTTANIGDSRITAAVVDASTGALTGVALSIDHKPDRPDEKARILAAGGRVFAVEYDDGVDGPPRVWLGNIDVPGLAMSRSVGDAVAHSAGVSSEPEFTTRILDAATDRFLIVASDGLWEFVSDQEAVDMVAGCDGDASRAVDVLINEANSRWMREEQVIDDTTVIVAYLRGQ